MRIPENAKALIVAQFENDDCDTMTDYFNTRRTETVALAFSTHTKDLFAELRKAAATFPPTAAMAPGQDIYTVYVALETDIRANGAYFKGGRSHWHKDIEPAEPFLTRAAAEAFIANAPAPEPMLFDGVLATFAFDIRFESFEKRQKYSMGRGYYLTMGDTYGTGWRVRKTSLSEYRDGAFTADLTGGGAVLKAADAPPEVVPTNDDVFVDLNVESPVVVAADAPDQEPQPTERRGVLLQFKPRTAFEARNA